MKRLFLAVALIAVFISASAVDGFWNFSLPPFATSSIIGTPPVTIVTPVWATQTGIFNTADGLAIVGTSTATCWALNANVNTIGATTYTIRLQSGDGGDPFLGSFIPRTLYMAIRVTGASTIEIGAMSSLTENPRKLIIASSDGEFVDSIVGINNIGAYSYNYTGPAATLYLYSWASGINFYYLSATNIDDTFIFADSRDAIPLYLLSKVGEVLLNPSDLEVEIYSDKGYKILTTTDPSIGISGLPNGEYIAKTTKGTLKFIR